MKNAGVAAHIHHYFVSVELPLGMGKFAGRNGAVIDEVVIGTGLFHDFAGEGKWSGRGQHHAVAANAQSSGRGDVVEAPGLSRQIVSSVTGLDVFVVGTAVESEVAGGRGLAAVGVVGNFVGTQDVGAIVNLGVAVQFVDVAVFFLLAGRRSWSSRESWVSARLAQSVLAAGAAGSIFCALSCCGRSRRLAGILCQQLAGY